MVVVQALWHSGSGARQAVAIQISHGQSHLLSAGSSSWKNIDIAPGAQSASRRSRQKAIQFLNEIGARGLRMHLGRVLEMAESSPDKAAYEQKINERFGMEQQRDLPIPTPLPAPTEAAN